MSINEKGCSVCKPGEENYVKYEAELEHHYSGEKKSIQSFQYDYRTKSGELFSCCAETLDKCREKRDQWLKRKANPKKFKIKVEEVLWRTIEVEAENEISALSQVKDMIDRCEIVLDADDFIDRTIKISD